MRFILPGLLVAALASAQTHQEQITVNVVEVPVYVERATGGPLAGLTKDDFELYVNGSRHPIDYFDVLDETAPDERVPLHRRRLFVLLFDLARSSPFGILNGKRAATKVVSQAAAGDVFAIATIGKFGIRFAVPFTTDRVEVQRAIDTLSPGAGRDPLNLPGPDAQQRDWYRVASNQSNFGRDFDPPEWEQSERMIEQLGDLADRLAGLNGIKHVILLTELITTADPLSNRMLLPAAIRMHRRYRGAGVILDAVDLAGLRAPWGVTDSVNAPSMLYALTLDTGGTVTSSLANLQKNRAVTYILGFRPRGPQKKQNNIFVRVKNASWLTSVRFRRGYATGSEHDSTKIDPLVLADIVTNDIPQNGLSVSAAVATTSGKVEVAVSVPGRELLALTPNMLISLDVYIYVFDERSRIADWTYARISLDRDAGRDFLSSNPYTVRKDFDLPPGRYAAKALIRVVGTDVTGFRRADFQISQP